MRSPYVYMIFDSVHGVYYRTSEGKQFWNTVGGARHAWNAVFDDDPGDARGNPMVYSKFDNQDDYVVHRLATVYKPSEQIF